MGIELVRHCGWNELEHMCMICWSACFKPTATNCCGNVYCERCICWKVQKTKECHSCHKRLRMKKLRCEACDEWMPFVAPVATTTCVHVFCMHCLGDNCLICGRRLHGRDILDLHLMCMICWSAFFKLTAISCCGNVYCERCICWKLHKTKECHSCHKRLRMKLIARLLCKVQANKQTETIWLHVSHLANWLGL
uniref:uncharacterized protein LOC101309728 isoform X1 n=1 Tax=Fragaria vesca subsp. vesca TaxID=101020 RepID=UPI0005C7FEAD|nr:PREDICTED: uncharacterized protein LOC101309728 isoform X1 [Fragaria vesca subsp. vesca]